MANEASVLSSSGSRVFAGLRKTFVLGLSVMLLVQTAAAAAQEPTQKPQPVAPAATEMSSLQPPEELPSAPVPQAPAQPQQQTQQQPGGQPAQQQPQSQPAQQPATPEGQQPVGTAAAPYEKPTGVPGSRPAGAAIAPAKQRRVRAIVISFAVILAGAGAIGAVAGMSKASHSQP